MSVRRLAWLLGAAALGAVLAFRSAPHNDVGSDAASRIQGARTYFDSVAGAVRGVRDPSHLAPATAVALGYLERLRLGQGSPFRLIDFALHDPRLSGDMQSRVAWALLDRTLRGDDYQVDPCVLDDAGVRDTADGDSHADLIARTIARASDAREGELAVRLAYALSAGEGTLRPSAVTTAAQVAALMRDRRLAREDAQVVFRRARADGLPPFDEIVRLRAERALSVETPSAAPLGADQESRAVAEARMLVDSVRQLRSGGDGRTAQPQSLLGVAAAQRLVQVGAATPWESAVAVTLGSYRPLLVGDSVAAPLRVSRQRFADGALNEETLPAMYALLRAGGDTGVAPARAMLAVSTALRAFAQESPWFPGSEGPSEADLRRDFGIAGVKFDHDVPTTWRSYYLGEIRAAIGDLHRVLPALSLEGVRIRFGIDGLPDSALAMHDPATRTVRLSIRSSAGALAHEFAHDLDWQAARRLYEAGGYGTDQAARDGTGPLSEPVLALTSRQGVRWRGASAAGGVHNESSERPAELFARGMDWFVASSLAAEGRSDGYLTSAQDALLAGYASASPAAMTPTAARALMTAASRMTFVPEALRDRFLADWANPENSDPLLLVERVMGTWPGHRGPSVSGPMLPGAPELPSTACVDAPNGAPVSVRARAELLDLALDARARGIAARRASWYPWSRRPAWAHAVLGDAPWSSDAAVPVLSRIRNGVAAELSATMATLGPLQESFPTFRVESSGRCGG